MSVINRMLSDLERRGAPGARRLGASEQAPRERARPPRRGPALARLAPVVLLAGLVVVAATLWQRHWSEIRQWAVLDRGAPSGQAAAQASPSQGERPAGDAPAVTRFTFERAGDATRLVVGFDEPLPQAPAYGRSGDRLGLRLPARWGAAELPSPPAGQSVYRGVALDARDDQSTRVGITIDPEARFDLDHGGRQLVLTGRGRYGGRTKRIPGGRGNRANRETDAATPGNETRVASRATAGAEPDGSSDAEAQATADTADDRGPAGDSDTGDTTPNAGEVAQDDGAQGKRSGADDPSGTAKTAAAATGGTDDESAGSVRKSAPEVSPAERARRLESAARRALENGEVAKARRQLMDALARDPGRHSARDLLVALTLRRGDAATARNLLAEGVARAPGRTAYAKPFARLLVDAGDLERALAVLERAAPAAGDDAGYHGLMAAVAQRLERHELAASAYTRALDLDESRGLWWMGLGISLRATDHPAEALAAFREARASGDLNERLDRWVQRRIDALSDSAQ